MTTRTLYIGDYEKSYWSMRPWLAMTNSGLSSYTRIIPLDQPQSKTNIHAVSPSGKVPMLIDGSDAAA